MSVGPFKLTRLWRGTASLSIADAAMTLSIMTFIIMTLSIERIFVTLSINKFQHK
jgi:hypothetical protein